MSLEKGLREWLERLGEDPGREGLRKGAAGIRETWEFFTAGYAADVPSILVPEITAEEYHDVVLVKDIDFISMCEHHFLPFFGRCHVAYIPGKYMVGLGSIARLVEVYSRRLQIQERISSRIADAMEKYLSPSGVAVVMEASHLCMVMEGMEKMHSRVVTSVLRGAFLNNEARQREFYRAIGMGEREDLRESTGRENGS